MVGALERTVWSCETFVFAPGPMASGRSGISETGSELGGALGIAILGSIGVAIYRGRVAEAIPNGVPAEAAAAARDTLGGAVAVAQELPDQVAVALVDAARGAFVAGMHLTSTIATIVSIGLAVLAVVALRDLGGNDEAAAGEADEPSFGEPAGSLGSGLPAMEARS